MIIKVGDFIRTVETPDELQKSGIRILAEQMASTKMGYSIPDDPKCFGNNFKIRNIYKDSVSVYGFDSRIPFKYIKEVLEEGRFSTNPNQKMIPITEGRLAGHGRFEPVYFLYQESKDRLVLDRMIPYTEIPQEVLDNWLIGDDLEEYY